jgi:Raf kinase inhibitor-like YbhB/YbcL family protein
MHNNRFLRKLLTRRTPALIGAAMLLLLGILVVPYLVSLTHSAQAAPSSDSLHPFTITSPDFQDGGPLPVSSEFGEGFGCHGQNIAPELDWRNVPSKTESFAMLMTDYDAPVAGGFHHWIVYNIPQTASELDGTSPFSQGTNSFGLVGYDGPCPPPTGQLHHYVFTLYALNTSHIAGEALTYDQVINAISANVLGATSIIGTFKRPL